MTFIAAALADASSTSIVRALPEPVSALKAVTVLSLTVAVTTPLVLEMM